ncbi:MAG: sigma-70 family RNA polymerase sigma factor [Actinobacteria bacterium]|nr:sigma-70 family RNA polymerase sigma factor [Actinomycetota bacterium]
MSLPSCERSSGAVPDGLLVQRSKRGDLGAFEELVARYEKKVYNLAFRLTGNHDDADDVAQEALLRAYTSLSSFRGDSSFSTWLYRIVTNAGLDEIRRRRRRATTSLDDPLSTREGEVARQVPDASEGPVEIAERIEVREQVQEAINSLADDHRVVLILRDLQGLSYAEIAGILRCPLGTVRSKLSRARERLKFRLIATRVFDRPPTAQVSDYHTGTPHYSPSHIRENMFSCASR